MPGANPIEILHFKLPWGDREIEFLKNAFFDGGIWIFHFNLLRGE